VPDELKPPSAASQLLSWIRDPHLPQILGDMSEEYGERARSLGAAAARRWYWREAIRNAGVLVWRKGIAGSAFIAFLAVLTTNILFAIMAEIVWHMWTEAMMWKSQYRPLLYRQSWGMGWPMGFVFEILCAPLVGLAVGHVFGIAAPERAKHVRIAAGVIWMVSIACFTLWLFGGLQSLSQLQIPAFALHVKRLLWLEFVSRELVSAGAFFIGAGVALRRRKEASPLSAS